MIKWTYSTNWYCFLEPGPGAVMVGNLLRGTRIGEASGREIGEITDADKRVSEYRSKNFLSRTYSLYLELS